MKNKIYYIAHPYTGDVKENLRKCAEMCNDLLDMGFVIFSPITHSHQLHVLKERSAKFWYEQDLELLKRFDGIIFGPNWDKSKGCNLELDLANEHGLDILYYDELRERPIRIK